MLPDREQRMSHCTATYWPSLIDIISLFCHRLTLGRYLGEVYDDVLFEMFKRRLRHSDLAGIPAPLAPLKGPQIRPFIGDEQRTIRVTLNHRGIHLSSA